MIPKNPELGSVDDDRQGGAGLATDGVFKPGVKSLRPVTTETRPPQPGTGRCRIILSIYWLLPYEAIYVVS